MHTYVSYPGGQSADLSKALDALVDGDAWKDPSSHMYLAARADGQKLAQMTVVRRGDRVCIHCFEFDEEPGGQITIGDPSIEGVEEVYVVDTVMAYPKRYFIPLQDAVEAVRHFTVSLRRWPGLVWAAFDLGELLSPEQ